MAIYSNYYIKLRMTSMHTEEAQPEDDGLCVKIPVEEDNVFTVCPVCGREHPVNLAEVVTNELSFLDTSVFCDKCGKLRMQNPIVDIDTILMKFGSGERELHLDRWEPKTSEKPALVKFFRKNYEEILEDCGDHEEAAEAKALYNLVKDNPLSASKDEIQEYFSFAFECVGGEMEKYYDKWPEMIRLINLTVSPDPIDGADAGILEGGI